MTSDNMLLNTSVINTNLSTLNLSNATIQSAGSLTTIASGYYVQASNISSFPFQTVATVTASGGTNGAIGLGALGNISSGLVQIDAFSSITGDNGRILLTSYGNNSTGVIQLQATNVNIFGDDGLSGSGKLNAAMINVAMINAAMINAANVSTNTILIRDGLTLEGAGTITINGSSGAPGQVVGIPLGASYPEWTTATPAGGIYPLAGTEGTTITFDIPGMNANGVVMPVYIKPGLVGGQWIKSVTPSDGTVTIEVGLATTAGDSVIWSVISFGTP
jgi:hypothetical protein